MKNLFAIFCMLGFAFTALAGSAVSTAKFEKPKIEKTYPNGLSFDVVVFSEIGSTRAFTVVDTSFPEGYIGFVHRVESNFVDPGAYKITYNYKYPWCKINKDVDWLSRMQKV